MCGRWAGSQNSLLHLDRLSGLPSLSRIRKTSLVSHANAVSKYGQGEEKGEPLDGLLCQIFWIPFLHLSVHLRTHACRGHRDNNEISAGCTYCRGSRTCGSSCPHTASPRQSRPSSGSSRTCCLHRRASWRRAKGRSEREKCRQQMHERELRNN